MLQHDAQAEGGQHRDKEIALDQPEDDDTVEPPPDCIHRRRGKRNRQRRGHALADKPDHHIAAQHHQLALRHVDQVHHAPDQRHAIGGQRKDRAGQQAIHHELRIQLGALEQHRQVGHLHHAARPRPPTCALPRAVPDR
ncbi:hypothetical protein D3C72_1810950 [compost metagenome]